MNKNNSKINFFAIKEYLFLLEKSENDFKNISKHTLIKDSNKIKDSKFKTLVFITKCFVDYIVFQTLLLLGYQKNKSFVYTAYNFCDVKEGMLKDRVHKPLQLKNYVYINSSKEIYISKIDGKRVYNLGGLVKLLAFFMNYGSKKMNYFMAYQYVNDSLFWHAKQRKIYFMWFYDLNNLAISFSKYRYRLNINEIQHGSMINYPPYMHAAPIQLVDTFYVKNVQTIAFLENQFCKNFTCSFKLIPYPAKNVKPKEGIHILYASTIEFNGLHPVFISFLQHNNLKNVHIQVRLHPRERNPKKIQLFENQFKELDVNFKFNDSENWLIDNKIENLLVISPWSSTIEDAVDNGYKTVIIDPVGDKRFHYLFDNKRCIFTSNLTLEHLV